MKSFSLCCLAILAPVFVLSSCSGPAPAIPVVSTVTVEPTLPPTPVPSPTPPPLPTVLLEPKLYNIDIAQLKEVPQDMLEQMYTYSGGAGGGDSSVPEQPPIWEKSYAGAVEPAVPTSLSWIAIIYSNFPTPEAQLTLPDGSRVQMERNYSGHDNYYETSYPIVPGSLLGTYTLEITQGSFMIQDSVNLELPSKPIWTAYQDNNWYAGFKPGEQVTLHICEYLFFSWRNGVSLSELTKLSQYLPGPEGQFISVCQKQHVESITADEYGTFQVHVPDGYWVDVQAGLSGVETTIPTCGDLFPPRLELGGIALPDDAQRPTGYTQDGTKISLQQGSKMKTVFGPICNQYLERWEWVVETSNQTLLWVSDGYSLRPANS